MNEIIERFLIVLWMLLGVGLFFSSLAGWKDGSIIFAIMFGLPMVFYLAYVVIKWIITGKSD